ncbi:MAG: replication initiation protein [Saprospiraceae bacterium]|nr:replication initiation protein [Saprospiraceae bacterium]
MEQEEIDKDIDNKPVVVLTNSEHIFVQSNDFIRAKYKDNMSFWEFLIFGKMCTDIAPDDEDFKEYTVYVKDLINFLGISDGGSVYRYVLEAASRLLERRVVVTYKDERGRRMVLETNLIAGFAKPEKLAKNDPLFIRLSFHPQLKPFLLQLQKDFTKVDLRNYKFLRTGTSIRLYHLLKQYWGRRQQTVEIVLEELKEMLGVADKYELYGHFKAAVLEEAQKRLMDTTDISFSYQEIKKGKKVVAILFHIKESKGGHLVAESPQVAPRKRQTTEQSSANPTLAEGLLADLTPLVCTKWGVSDKMWHSLVEKHTEETLREAVKITETALDLGKVKDAAGFFVQAVRQGYKGGHTQQSPQKVRIEAQETQMRLALEQKEIANRHKQMAFEKEKQNVLTLLSTDSALRLQVIERLHTGILRGSYDDTKSFDENMKTPLLLGAVLNIVKKIQEGE